jgi:hypothetical protein
MVKPLLRGASLRLRAKGYLKQPPLAGAQDSKHLRTLVRITGRILQEVKDARGLRAKVTTADGTKAFKVTRAKIASQRRLNDEQLKVAASAPARVAVPLEC